MNLPAGEAQRERAAPSTGTVRGIACVGYGELYRKMMERLLASLDALDVVRHAPCAPRHLWERAGVDKVSFPVGSATKFIVDGWDYTGYCMKPEALADIAKFCDLCLLLDASCVAIKPLDPLWEHIEKHGYYLGESGFSCGQWTSDEMLEAFRMTRDAAMLLPQCASGIIGLDMREPASQAFVNDWCNLRRFFPGHHSNVNAETRAYSYRNEGWVSDDPRCLGHRHDQSAAALLAHQLGLTDFQPWTKPGSDAGFVAYGRQNVTQRSVLVVEGF